MSKSAIDSTDEDGPATATTDGTPRDAAQIVVGDWPRRDLPSAITGQRERRYQAVVRQSALNKIHRHGHSADEIEVCGVLVGNVHHDATGPWLYVEHVIEGNHATQRAAQVTFTADTWAHIQAVMDRDYPDRRILGWYHTHPGFGIFLSDMDVFIQDNFFGEPWQVALVYDPGAKEEGLFLWKAGKPRPDRFLVEPDATAEEAATMIEKARDVSPMAIGRVTSVDPVGERLDAIERRQRTTMMLLALLALFALAWPLAVVAFLPGLQRKQPAPPPINLPSDDPTSRPMKYYPAGPAPAAGEAATRSPWPARRSSSPGRT
jgi:proteasome lid subunit RPN8/RPN11